MCHAWLSWCRSSITRDTAPRVSGTVERMRSALRSFTASLVLASLSACSRTIVADGDGGAPEPVSCDVAEQPLGPNDDAGLGFTPADVLARFGGARQATLEYYAGGTTELSLELSLTGAAKHVSTSTPDGVDPDDLIVPCGEQSMLVPVELRFTTADGEFDERIPATWQLTDLNELEQINESIDLDAIEGSFEADADELSFVISLKAGDPNGEIIGVVLPEDDLPSEFNIARFNQTTWPQSE